jgi:hypothetical protein
VLLLLIAASSFTACVATPKIITAGHLQSNRNRLQALERGLHSHRSSRSPVNGHS